MLNYFNSSEVLRIIKLLKELLAEFEAVRTKRARLCAGSYNSHEDNLYNSKLDPSSFYLFRFLDKSVTITRDYHSKDLKFQITLENWRPNREQCGDDNFDIETNSFGSFDTIDKALIRFKDYCVFLLNNEFQCNLNEQLELF